MNCFVNGLKQAKIKTGAWLPPAWCKNYELDDRLIGRQLSGKFQNHPPQMGGLG